VLITLFVQVIATTLLPAALVFLILLLNDKKTMGKVREHAVAEHRERDNRGFDRDLLDAVRGHDGFSEHFCEQIES
jgi:Mn2+/Fe2+ NRAMP family transporter